jgi:uncharacterized protein (DUF952 family)
VPAAFASEGFVHCSYAHQIRDTGKRYYSGRTDVVVLEIDDQQLSADVVAESSPETGELFPHVYGPIERNAVVAITPPNW